MEIETSKPVTEQSKYLLEPVLETEHEIWNQFVEDSPQGTVFSNSVYLIATLKPFALYWVKKGDRIKAGVALMLDKNGQPCLDDMVIYNGILFAKDEVSDQHKSYKILSNQFQITEEVIRYLTTKYQSIELSLSPFVRDLRAFSWYNYHGELAQNKFQLDALDAR